MKKINYLWNEELGMASCSINYKDKEFYGVAFCHPDDEDMKSKLTGQMIAEWRAMIECFKHIKNSELKPQIKILKQFYNNISKSKKFQQNSYENKMLLRQIRFLENDLNTINKNLV